MSFSEAIKVGLNKFFTPYGRASRSEYWWYALFIYIIGGVLGWFGGRLQSHGMEQVWFGVIFEVLTAVLSASLVCAGIRRMHDISKSGWNICWNLIPLVGWIIVLVMFCKASTPGENQYGPEPR